MKNTNFLTPQTPTASKRGLIAGIVAITAFIAVGVFSYLSFENSNGLPPAPPEVASQFQGKLDKDNMGILKKSKEDNKGEKNHKSEGEKVLKAGGFHWVLCRTPLGEIVTPKCLISNRHPGKGLGTAFVSRSSISRNKTQKTNK